MTNRIYYFAQETPEGSEVKFRYGRLTYTHIANGYFIHPKTGKRVDLWGRQVYVVGQTVEVNELEWV